MGATTIEEPPAATEPTEPDPGSGSETSPPSEPKGEAQKTAAELDAEEAKARTTYVLLRQVQLSAQDGPGEVTAWEELDRILAASRPAAWEEAKRLHPLVVPEVNQPDEYLQLVPERFWREIRSFIEQKPPEARAEGL